MTPQTEATIQPVRSGHVLCYRLLLVGALSVLSVLVPVPRSALAADFSSLQWANQTIRLQQAWQDVPTRGAGTRVCAVDTGVMLDHPDLKDAIIGGINTADATAPTSFGDDGGHLGRDQPLVNPIRCGLSGCSARRRLPARAWAWLLTWAE